MDRRVVEQLAARGDNHEIARPVDHFVHFADVKSRDAFIVAMRSKGFSAEQGHDGVGDRPFTAQAVREDRTELHHLHDVVMEVISIATSCGGEYDGWGAEVREG